MYSIRQSQRQVNPAPAYKSTSGGDVRAAVAKIRSLALAAHNIGDPFSDKQKLQALITCIEYAPMYHTQVALILSDKYAYTFDEAARTVSKWQGRLQAKEGNVGLAGRNPMQALIDHLEIEDIPHKVKVDDLGRVTHLFFTFPDAIKLAKTSPTVLVMDSTYKTNKYKMPLLHAVGVSSTYHTFSAFFCFLRTEQAKDYDWALGVAKELFGPDFEVKVIITDNDAALMKAVKTHFPEAKNLLCCWHIYKNNMAKHRRAWETEADWLDWLRSWHGVVNQRTPQDFEEAWQLLKLRTPEKVSEYIEAQWLTQKEHFVVAPTSIRAHRAHPSARSTAPLRGQCPISQCSLHPTMSVDVQPSDNKSKKLVQLAKQMASSGPYNKLASRGCTLYAQVLCKDGARSPLDSL